MPDIFYGGYFAQVLSVIMEMNLPDAEINWISFRYLHKLRK